MVEQSHIDGVTVRKFKRISARILLIVLIIAVGCVAIGYSPYLFSFQQSLEWSAALISGTLLGLGLYSAAILPQEKSWGQ